MEISTPRTTTEKQAEEKPQNGREAATRSRTRRKRPVVDATRRNYQLDTVAPKSRRLYPLTFPYSPPTRSPTTSRNCGTESFSSSSKIPAVINESCCPIEPNRPTQTSPTAAEEEGRMMLGINDGQKINDWRDLQTLSGDRWGYDRPHGHGVGWIGMATRAERRRNFPIPDIQTLTELQATTAHWLESRAERRPSHSVYGGGSSRKNYQLDTVAPKSRRLYPLTFPYSPPTRPPTTSRSCGTRIIFRKLLPPYARHQRRVQPPWSPTYHPKPPPPRGIHRFR